MRRVLISLLAAFPLARPPATTLASTGRATDGPQGPCATVAGTVVSVDAANHQFVANAYVLPTSAGNHCPIPGPPPPILTAPDGGPRAVTPPATTKVAIGVDANTRIRQAKNPPRHRQLFAFVGTVTGVS